MISKGNVEQNAGDHIICEGRSYQLLYIVTCCSIWYILINQKTAHKNGGVQGYLHTWFTNNGYEENFRRERWCIHNVANLRIRGRGSCKKFKLIFKVSKFPTLMHYNITTVGMGEEAQGGEEGFAEWGGRCAAWGREGHGVVREGFGLG